MDKIGKFQVLQTLGSGAHSSILHIRREADSKEYALKLVDIEDKDDLKYLEQAKHEYRVGQMLSHPNLVKVYCLETDAGWFSGPKKAKLLLEYVPGRTMDKLPLQRMARLVRMFERIADGLTHMHKQGVYHADMKPNNLILERGTRVHHPPAAPAAVRAVPHRIARRLYDVHASCDRRPAICDARADRDQGARREGREPGVVRRALRLLPQQEHDTRAGAGQDDDADEQHRHPFLAEAERLFRLE